MFAIKKQCKVIGATLARGNKRDLVIAENKLYNSLT